MSYQERFPMGTLVQIASRDSLVDFQTNWHYHHPLTAEQLQYAGKIARVDKVGFYHGGDVLYELENVPETWHEQCLGPAIART